MTKRFFQMLALALPLLLLAGSIALHAHMQKAATLWHIPVRSFDPRLPLRGHYFRFTYAWQLQGDPRLCSDGSCMLCLAKSGGDVMARVTPLSAQCAHPLRLPSGNVQPSRSADGSLSFNGRIFVSEASAPKLEAAMQDGKALLIARLTKEGALIPQQLVPR